MDKLFFEIFKIFKNQISNSDRLTDDFLKNPSTDAYLRARASLSSTASHTCSTCMRYFETIKTCAGCHNQSYCSVPCQKKNWKVHKNICTVIKSSNN
jgi:hypothetical protein